MVNISISCWNVNYKRDIANALLWSRWILRLLGIWPLVYQDTSTIEKILATILFTFCWSVLNFLMIPLTLYTISDQTVTTEKVRMLGPLGYVIISMLKYFFLVIRYKSIRQCIRVLSIDWCKIQQEDHRKIMIRNTAKGHVLSKFCFIFMYCGGLSYHTVMPFLSQRTDRELNASIGPIPYPGYDHIFDLNFMPTYMFVFCAQWFCGIIMFNITTAVCCLAALFVAHACGQIEIVMDRLENLVKVAQNNGVNSKHRVAIIVKHHVQALRFSASIENILREICLVEIVGSTLIICLLEYYCMTEWSNSDSIAIMTYFFLLISFVFNIFMFCYIGEQLTNQCSKVGHTSYKIEWYHLPGKLALDLKLMINMSHHPIKITAGKLVSLSFSSFGQVLKASITYFNLLRTMV